MRKGRRPARHHAVRDLKADINLSNALDELESAIGAWLRGQGAARIFNAVEVIETATSAAGQLDGDHEDFTRDDRVAWTARRYKEAVEVSTKIAELAQRAASVRDTILAELAEACVVPPIVPTYGARFVTSLIAQGAGQNDLHPATKAKARAALTAIRQHQPDPQGREAYRAPPVRDWAELPREFAAFRLEDVGETDLIFTPSPLPPHTDIAAYSIDGLDPGQGDTLLDTYAMWAKILADWATREGRSLDGDAQRAWLVLLGHRLKATDENLKRMECLPVQSPWDATKAVRSVWIGELSSAGAR